MKEQDFQAKRKPLLIKSRSILYHLNTLFLFMKSDFKTIVLPQTVFAIATTLYMYPFGTTSATTYSQEQNPFTILVKFFGMQAWIWVHLLVQNIANQRLGPSVIEDRNNKPWRPMPAGRITQNEAESILRALVPLAVSFSFLCGASLPSATILTLIWLYNDLDGASAGPFQRNDFPDMAGDRARDRKTLPLTYPEMATRIVLALLTVFWSLACLIFWNAVMLAWVGLLSVGGAMAVLTVCQRKQWYDEMVWKLWCLWMAFIYLLPAFSRPLA
ncbi:UbiA prenyltransferase family-domain-containing protein [Camillea tinctor]|nr:UbiA prenyltransferase family-domain-containing protein [Camillea tinctor]